MSKKRPALGPSGTRYMAHASKRLLGRVRQQRQQDGQGKALAARATFRFIFFVHKKERVVCGHGALPPLSMRSQGI